LGINIEKYTIIDSLKWCVWFWGGATWNVYW